jgi:threonylcarbamoyladenosine tRNA methylthiotransferase MtaB
MMTFHVNTLGCKVNQYESQQIRELLEKLGLRESRTDGEKSDLVVVNTCCVTHTASAKSRQYINKATRLSSDAVVIVCGCLPTVQISELSSLHKNTKVVKHQHDLASALRNAVCSIKNRDQQNNKLMPQCIQSHPLNTIKPQNAEKIKDKNNLISPNQLPPLTKFKGQTRAFLKVQDGCDGYCSYCIIPKTRPILTSKPLDMAINEAKNLLKAGHKEIVITGVHLGAYGRTTVSQKTQNDKLADLLINIAQIQNLPRIRLSSLEPTEITPKLLRTIRNHPNIMPHLHLSLQSGSDTILKKMCRQYSSADFMRTVDQIKAALDRPAITTDVIVGFPGESEEDFEQTLKLARKTGFAKIHVFKFSKRNGTKAADMQNPVNSKIINERSKTLRNLDMELGRKFREKFVGQTLEILVENNKDLKSGLTRRYFKVFLPDHTDKPITNKLIPVKLIKTTPNGAIGKILDDDASRINH